MIFTYFAMAYIDKWQTEKNIPRNLKFVFIANFLTRIPQWKIANFETQFIYK